MDATPEILYNCMYKCITVKWIVFPHLNSVYSYKEKGDTLWQSFCAKCYAWLWIAIIYTARTLKINTEFSVMMLWHIINSYSM